MKSTNRSLIACVRVHNMDKSNRDQPLDPKPNSKAHNLTSNPQTPITTTTNSANHQESKSEAPKIPP